MKVSELIEELKRYDADADVHFAHGAGDYWRTTLAPKVTRVFDGFVVPSGYYQNQFKLIEDQDEEDVRTVVVIE
jgi:hypothetical protein